MAKKLPASRATVRMPSGSPDTPAPMGHNGADEAERIQLIAFVSKLSAAEEAIEVAKGPLKAAQKARSTVVNLAKAAGFTAKELERRMDEMNRPTREIAADVARERKHRRWLGIIDADQEELFTGDSAPQSAKDEVHWQAEGYKAGLRFQKAEAPKGITGLDLQSWLNGHAKGWAEATEATAANVPKQMPSVRDKAAADFKEDNPEPEPGSPEAKKLEREALRRAKESLDKMNGGDAHAEGEMAAGVIHEPGTNGVGEIVDNDPLGANGPDDGFTMTDEELAAQAGRRQPEDESDVV